MWDYSELSAEACKLGGPDALRAAYVKLGVRLGLGKGFILGAVTVGVPVVGWKVLKDFRDRRADAAAQAAAAASEAAPTTEEAVLAEAEAVIATAGAVPVPAGASATSEGTDA